MNSSVAVEGDRFGLRGKSLKDVLDSTASQFKPGVQTERIEVKIMDDLIKQVTQKAGISENQAKQAIETVLGFIKDKLPAPIASQVAGVLGGGETPDLGDVGEKLGGLLGKK